MLAFNRNSVGALHSLGQCKLFAGSIEETIPLVEQAIRLSPRDPQLDVWYRRIGQVHLLQSRTDEAIVWFEKARNANPEHSSSPAYLASAYALKGETERAITERAEARRLGGEGSWSSIAGMRRGTRYETPTIRALAEATLYDGLREAGMQEE